MYLTYSLFSSFARASWGSRAENLCASILLAYAADLTVKPLVHPIETVVIRLNRSEVGLTAGVLIPQMLRQECVRSFYRGIGMHLGNSWRQGLTEGAFEALRRLVSWVIAANGTGNGQVLQDGELGASTAFLIGWAARALATAITFPLLRLRTTATALQKNDSVFSAAQRILREQGWSGFFSGLIPEMIRAATLQATLNLVKEHLTQLNRGILTGVR